MSSTHRTTIDETAPAVTRQERVVGAAPARVLALLRDVTAWPAWQPEVQRVDRVEPQGLLRVGSTFRWRSGGVWITSTVVELEEGRAIAWTGRAVGTRAVHTWVLDEVPGGTRVRTEESMSGWLPRLLPGAVRRTLENGVASTLDALAAEA
ncbi:SRPBCC family protein [Aquipuribacter nitratireducens]|uniref:SRPBCC family protein n=1 Tax=Aquipuribacter nitratireducens TaxID=650104 RepID=A0ABW0GRF7_9MICO